MISARELVDAIRAAERHTQYIEGFIYQNPERHVIRDVSADYDKQDLWVHIVERGDSYDEITSEMDYQAAVIKMQIALDYLKKEQFKEEGR